MCLRGEDWRICIRGASGVSLYSAFHHSRSPRHDRRLLKCSKQKHYNLTSMKQLKGLTRQAIIQIDFASSTLLKHSVWDSDFTRLGFGVLNLRLSTAYRIEPWRRAR